MAEAFDSTKDYTKTGDVYERQNYKAYVGNLSQDEIAKLLAENIVGSELKLTIWDKQNLAEYLAEIKFGKDEDER